MQRNRIDPERKLEDDGHIDEAQIPGVILASVVSEDKCSQMPGEA